MSMSQWTIEIILSIAGPWVDAATDGSPKFLSSSNTEDFLRINSLYFLMIQHIFLHACAVHKWMIQIHSIRLP